VNDDASIAADLLSRGFIESYPALAATAMQRYEPVDMGALLSHQGIKSLLAVWPYFEPAYADALLPHVDASRLAQLLVQMDPLDCARILNRQEPERRDRYLDVLAAPQREEVARLMQYPPRTAGQMMNARITRLFADNTVAEALAKLRRDAGARFRHVFVVDAAGMLQGIVDIQDLALSERRRPLGDILQPAPAIASPFDPVDEVAERLRELRLEVLPVVDVSGRLLGALGHRSLMRVLETDALSDMQTMVGGSPDERSLSTAWFAVRRRLPWLNINLATAFLAAAVVGLFESTIAQFTALAVLLPVVAGQSGNAGAQAQAVTIRGLALREVTVRHWPTLLRKELGVGLLNGLAIALVTSAGVLMWSDSAGLALVIALAMVISMVAAGVSGVLVPVLLTRLGQDPAQSSSIVLTTITDIVGFLSFLGIASLLSGLL
jgi:magnesium transporter